MVVNSIKIWIVTLVTGLVLATSVAVHAQDKIPWTHGGPLLPDSSNFVTASLLVIDPGPQTVSAMGHSAIRLECPVHNLDYCFTLVNNPEYSNLFFVLGKTPAHDIAVPTKEFLKEFVEEKRRVMQYELNLTLHEKQELWRAADIEFTNEGNRLFNYSYNGTDNCTSICLELIEQALIDEKIVVDKMPNILTKNNGTYFRHMSRRSPWVQFLLITLAGTACDETWDMRNRMAPEVIIPLFEHSYFEGQQGKRAMLKGEGKELVRGGVQIFPNPVTPVWVFGGLLVLALIISLLQYFHVGKKLVRLFDIGLFIFQLLMAALLLATSCYGSIVGTHWNWYLIPFNPLPLIIWLIWRKRNGFYKVYLFYTAVLILFILATPLSEQLDLPHQLITATLAVRCLFNYIDGKRNTITDTRMKKIRISKKSKKMINYKINYRLLLLLIICTFYEQMVWGTQTYHHWYRFQAEVKAQPTGAAKVYGAFPESNGSISFKENVFTCHKHFDDRTDEPVEGVSTGDLTAYLRYDNVADGYRFLHWVDSKGNIITSFDDTQQAHTANVTSDNLCYTGSSGTSGSSSGAVEHRAADEQHPYYTNETFTAVFEKLTTDPVVTVSTEGTNQEQVSAKVSPEENAVGDEVTISTQVNSDASLQAWKNKFLGWKFNGEFIKDGQGNIIRDVSYTFTINEDNKGEYVAVYEGDYSFFRIKCLGSPHRYASAIKDGINYASTNLSGNIKLSDNPTTYLTDAGTVLQFDYKRKPSGYSGSYHEVYVQNITASDGYDFASGSYIRITYIPQSNTYLFSTVATGGTRFRDNNGTPTLSNIEDEYGYWYIEPMDKDLETKENYFSLDPAKLVEVDGKYYTTLRTSWNILFNPEQMTPYIVKSVNETEGTFEMEPITGNIIPAGTPVIIETSSNVVLDNRMVPTKDAAASGAVPSGNLLQTSTKYFPNQSVSTSNNYKKLTVNAAGQLSFGGNALNSVNGNEAYLCVENEVILPSKIPILPLADIEQSGVKNKLYTIADELIAVEYRQVGEGNDVYLWCKDQGNVSIDKTERTSTQVDFMKQQGQQIGEWDQSNWVVLKLTGNTAISIADGAKGHHIDAASITGLYVDDVNYMIEVTGNQLTVGGTAEYTPNVYSPANFMLSNLNIRGGQGGQTSGDNDTYYFFMNPKIQEICKITFAEWKAPGNDDPGYFTVPHTSGFDGAFNIGGWQYNEYNDVSDDLVDESSYFFNAVVNRANINAYGPKAVEIEHNTTPDGALIVYPTDLMAEGHNVPTAIDNLQSGKTAIKVVYYNTMGIESTVPYPGINIVVTEYSDGTRSAVKMIR